jgi:hypothetical protein
VHHRPGLHPEVQVVDEEASSGPEVDLAQGLSADLLQPLLENEEFVRKMKELLPNIPGDESAEETASEIKGTVQSPQVHTYICKYVMHNQAIFDCWWLGRFQVEKDPATSKVHIQKS